MRKSVPTTLFFAALLAGPASAASINYVLTAQSTEVSFQLLQTPAVTGACSYSIDCFSIASVDVKVNSTDYAGSTVSFYSLANGGGLSIQDSNSDLLVSNDGPLVNNEAVQLFAGTLNAPALETFSKLSLLEDQSSNPTYPLPFLLNATLATTVPEPSTFALMAGASALLFRFRRRKRSRS